MDWLRFPLIVLVAYIHYYGPEIQPKEDIGTDIYNYLMILMSHVISRSAVPTFFLISSFYFFSKSDFNMDRQVLDWSKVTKKESSIEVASKYNGGLSSITKPHPKRAEFFASLDASPSVIDLIDKSSSTISRSSNILSV